MGRATSVQTGVMTGSPDDADAAGTTTTASGKEPPQGLRWHRERSFHAPRLWLIVSGLWAAATLLRAYRVWLPVEGWRAVITGPWLWIGLVLPPIMFAIAIFAVPRLMMSGGRSRFVP